MRPRRQLRVRRRPAAVAALACALALPHAAAAVPDDGPDPHRPGRALHGRTFHVPQGAQLTWEAWEGEGTGHILAVDVEDPAALSVARAGVDTPADRLRPGVALVRYGVQVEASAAPDAVLGVSVRGAVGEAGEHGVAAASDWSFAFTVHVVRSDRYGDRPAAPSVARGDGDVGR